MTIDEIITRAGGVGKLAHLLGVTHSSVCDWRRSGRIPVRRAKAANELLGLPLHEMRPDIWSPPSPPPAVTPSSNRTIA